MAAYAFHSDVTHIIETVHKLPSLCYLKGREYNLIAYCNQIGLDWTGILTVLDGNY